MTDLASRVDAAIHEPTQARQDAFDLTVAEVHTIEAPGRIDFGGSELEDPKLDPVPTEKRNPDDEHGWWRLEEGRYRMTYNETLDEGGPVLFQPRRALVEFGASHPTLLVEDGLPAVPLSIGGAGLLVKENARLSTLVPL